MRLSFVGCIDVFFISQFLSHYSRIKYEQHLVLGGVDTSAEMLMSFLFRYGGVDTGRNQMTEASTRLYRSTTLRCDGGEADFQPVNQLESCVKLFGTCYELLMTQMKEKTKGCESKSLLGSIVSPQRLQEERQRCIEKSSSSHKKGKQSKNEKSVHHAVKITHGSIPFTFRKGKSSGGSNPFTSNKDRVVGKKDHSKKRSFSEMAKGKIYALRSKGKISTPKEGPDLDDLDKILSRNIKRSKRGALIPKERPDLDAKRRQSESEKILTRGRKKRKNKKKQKRDLALTNFSMDKT